MLRRPVARAANVWVVALGTNDAPSAARTRNYVMRVMSMAGPRKVIWVNVVRPGGYHRVNWTLAALAKRFSNLTVLDWAGLIHQHRALLRSDRVHLTSLGYRVRATVIARSISAA
jgi:lysophospholipase L1-like esterase